MQKYPASLGRNEIKSVLYFKGSTGRDEGAEIGVFMLHNVKFSRASFISECQIINEGESRGIHDKASKQEDENPSPG